MRILHVQLPNNCRLHFKTLAFNYMRALLFLNLCCFVIEVIATIILSY
jgi:hypothetical protein